MGSSHNRALYKWPITLLYFTYNEFDLGGFNVVVKFVNNTVKQFENGRLLAV